MENTEIYGTFILHPNVKREQFIYASQNYGSLYAVHAKFYIENDFLKKAVLNLYNYKGLINIGFKAKNSTKYLTENYFKEGVLKLILPVQGLKKYKSTIIEFGDEIKFTDVKEIISERLLFKLKNKNIFKGQVFDNEFHYRGGTEIDYEKSKRKIRKGMHEEGHGIISRFCHTSRLLVYKFDPSKVS